MGRGTDGRGKHFGGDKERNRVGTELVEEAGEEIHGLELVDSVFRSVVFVVESRDDEEDEVGKEANNHHFLSTICKAIRRVLQVM
jgi:hypothetical protein